MKTPTAVFAGLAMLSLTVVLTRCSKKDNGPSTPPKQVQLQTSATLGSYLTDKDGHALYFFSNDAGGQNTCSGGCAVAWPVFNINGLTSDMLGTGLDLSDFKTITVSGGAQQLTYKTWPLYTYAPGGTPEAVNLTSGDAVGGVWFVAKPDYTVMLANTQLIGKDGNHYKSDYTIGDGTTVYFTDAKGLTLYAFKKDSANLNKYTKSDFSNDPTWPIYQKTTAVVPSVLDKTQFTTTAVYGKTQLTYKGWPLYNYSGDSTTRGATRGVSVGGAGTVWPVMVQNIAAAPHN
jgi:predicted lipoprotein with Yx(FWY)xxD motif